MKQIASVLIAFLFFLPALAQKEEANNKNSSIRTSDNGVHKWSTSRGSTNFNIEFRGEIEVTDDDKDIKSISSDGYLEISKTVFGSKRAIIIESQGGTLKKEYYEGRTKVDWEPNGRKWLSEILPEIVRNTTLAAESRVNRFYKQGGATAVIEEIKIIESDYVRSRYAKLLLQKDIRDQELPGVIRGLCNSIKSDYYLASLLKDNLKKLLSTKEATDAFIEGTKNISSDYYKSTVLKEGVETSLLRLQVRLKASLIPPHQLNPTIICLRY